MILFVSGWLRRIANGFRWCEARPKGREWTGQCKWRRGHSGLHENWSGVKW